MDALTKVLVGLYEEPDRSQVNALEYLKKYLGAPVGVDVDGLKRENEELKKQVEKLKKQINSSTSTSGGKQTSQQPPPQPSNEAEVEC